VTAGVVSAEPRAKPLVSVIVPCRNEERWIGPCLQSILDNDYPRDRLEVLVVDGMSKDGTRNVVESFAARFPQLQMVSNDRKITPTALNLGIAAARGSVIVRMDAHVEYPRDYISSLVSLLEESGADNVGGVCQTLPANNSAIARAVALGMSHPLGVGNSHFRIGAAENRWVDTVPFGCYRREVFDRIGTFDEELVRNQDDELNLRLIRHGGRILLSPRIVCKYYARDSLRKLWRMYYQYGYFKPLVVRKVNGVMTLRQLAPPLFVTCLAVGALLSPWSRLAAVALVLLLAIYAAVLAGCSIAVVRKAGWRVAIALCLVFPTLHISYGFGYLQGVLTFLVLRRRAREAAVLTPLSR
jgi:glycosyltransferase involved in cell wall biosynthesis